MDGVNHSSSARFNYQHKIVRSFAAAGLFLAGCHSGVTRLQNTGAQDAIASATSQFEKAFAQTNGLAIASQYMADGELLLASEQAIRDRDKIAEFFDDFFLHTGASKIQFKATQFQHVGSFANETGTFVTSASDGRPILDGEYIAIWRLVGDQWKLQVQAFNSNRQQNEPRDIGRDQPHGVVRFKRDWTGIWSGLDDDGLLDVVTGPPDCHAPFCPIASLR